MNSVTSSVFKSVSIRTALSCVCRRQRYHNQLMRQQSVRSLSASPEEKVIPPPTPDNQPKHYPEHIKSIVDQIAGLTLIEVADLNQLLKERLNIQDAPVMSMGAVAAPVDQEEEDEAEKPREKTSFTVKLVKFDETQKVKLIKEIKSLNTGMNLVQAKKFVESLPQMVKADIGKDEASKLKEQLETVGANCEIE